MIYSWILQQTEHTYAQLILCTEAVRAIEWPVVWVCECGSVIETTKRHHIHGHATFNISFEITKQQRTKYSGARKLSRWLRIKLSEACGILCFFSHSDSDLVLDRFRDEKRNANHVGGTHVYISVERKMLKLSHLMLFQVFRTTFQLIIQLCVRAWLCMCIEMERRGGVGEGVRVDGARGMRRAVSGIGVNYMPHSCNEYVGFHNTPFRWADQRFFSLWLWLWLLPYFDCLFQCWFRLLKICSNSLSSCSVPIICAWRDGCGLVENSRSKCLVIVCPFYDAQQFNLTNYEWSTRVRSITLINILCACVCVLWRCAMPNAVPSCDTFIYFYFIFMDPMNIGTKFCLRRTPQRQRREK